jgi:hypothetical protein
MLETETNRQCTNACFYTGGTYVRPWRERPSRERFPAVGPTGALVAVPGALVVSDLVVVVVVDDEHAFAVQVRAYWVAPYAEESIPD